MALRALCARL